MRVVIVILASADRGTSVRHVAQFLEVIRGRQGGDTHEVGYGECNQIIIGRSDKSHKARRRCRHKERGRERWDTVAWLWRNQARAYSYDSGPRIGTAYAMQKRGEKWGERRRESQEKVSFR